MFTLKKLIRPFSQISLNPFNKITKTTSNIYNRFIHKAQYSRGGQTKFRFHSSNYYKLLLAGSAFIIISTSDQAGCFNLLKPYSNRHSITVLVVGESQQGKSTFIKKLHEMAGKELPSSLVVGRGGKSTTKDVHIYTIPIKIRDILLKQSTSKEVDLQIEETLDMVKALEDPKVFKEYSSREDLKLVDDKILTEVDVKIIDTPGIKGDDKNDEDNMYKLCKTLQEVKHINCVVFMHKEGQYGTNFEESLKYYMNLFDVNIPIHIVHTKYTSDDHLKDLKANGMSYRIREFQENFLTISAQHWLVDNEPTEDYMFREFLTRKEMYQFITSILSEEKIDTSGIKLQKTRKIKQIDNKIIMGNQERCQGFGEGISRKNEELQSVLERINKLNRISNDLENEIFEAKKDYEKKTSDRKYLLGTKSARYTWGFTGKEETISFDSPNFPITHVEKVTLSKYCDWVEGSETKYKDDEVKHYSVKIKSSTMRGCFASLTFYTFLRYVYEKELPKLRREMYELEVKKEENDENLVKTKKNHQTYQNEIKNLEKKIKMYNEVNPVLEQDKIPLDLYPQIRKYYYSDVWNTDKVTDSQKDERERLVEAYHTYLFAEQK